MSAIGQPLSRVDGRQKVTGTATYSGEQQIANVAYGMLVDSVISKGRIRRIDTSAALAAPGVISVMTYENRPALQKAQAAMELMAMTGENRPPLDDERIYHAGQHVALVVAESFEQARYGASLVTVEYDEQTPVMEMDQPGGHRHDPESFMGMEELQIRRGKPGDPLPSDAVSVTGTYSTPAEHHNPMEPHATVAVWDDGKLTVYDATQAVMGTQALLAGMLGIAREQVRLICPFVGGGFGCKGFLWGHTVLAALAAREVRRPVKLVLHRRQMFTSTGHRGRTVQNVALSASPDGKLITVRHDITTDQSEIGDFMEPAGLTTRLLYACPNVEIAHHCVRLNIGSPTPMRAPGETPGSFALESAMDELSYALRMDPLALRIANHTDVQPQSGKPFSSKHLLDCYRIGAEKFGWSQRKPEPRSMRNGRWLVGMGMATATYPGYRMPASALARLQVDGNAYVEAATQDLGTGTYTIMTQIAADALGLPMERVRFALGDSMMPIAPTSGGSNSAASVGPAVHEACHSAIAELVKLAIADRKSPLHGCPAERIGFGDGRLFVKGEPSQGEPWIDVLKRAEKPHVEACVASVPFAPESASKEKEKDNKDSGAQPAARTAPPCSPVKPQQDHDADQEKYAFQSFGAQFAEVHVDPDLGRIRVTRVTSVQDIGRVLNKKTARSQVIGGVVFGIGMALTEETLYDPGNGRPITRNLADYHLPSNADVPKIDVHFIDEPDMHFNVLGVRGVGEIGITGVAAAIANAVYHATGKRIRDLPLTLDKVVP